MRTIAVCNFKGGVGKTTSTLNIGAALARLGHRVLLVDCDPQLNLTEALDVDLEPGQITLYDVLRGSALVSDAAVPTRWSDLWLVPASPRLTEIDRRRLVGERVLDARLPEVADYTLLDCPATPGIVMINALQAAREIVAPVQARGMASGGMQRLIDAAAGLRADGNPRLDLVGILVCMFDGRTRISHRVFHELRDTYGSLVFDTVIHDAVAVAEASDRCTPVGELHPDSRAAEEYETIARQLAHRDVREWGYFNRESRSSFRPRRPSVAGSALAPQSTTPTSSSARGR